MKRIFTDLGRGTLNRLMRTPRPVVERLIGPPPRNDRGALLDWQTHLFLNVTDLTSGHELHEMRLEESRRLFDLSTELFNVPRRPMESVEDVEIPGPKGSIPARAYRPSGESKMPACLFFHGGGFVLGTVDGHDNICRAFAERAGCVVVSVEYRLAPEHPFPAAIEDGAAAFRWLVDNAPELGAEDQPLVVAGDSAGGNIATVVCQSQLRDGGRLPDLQLLVYPSTQMAEASPSHRHFDEGYFLTESLREWFAENYLAGADRTDPRISPLLFEQLEDLPPALIYTAGFDPLRDEGEAYVDALRTAGVDVSHRSFDRLVHGFFTMGGVIDAAHRAVFDIFEELRRTLSR